MPPETRLPVTHHSLQRKCWVYYIRKGESIKIGTTRHLAIRMDQLEPDEILALEPGSYKREKSRHIQFEREHIWHPQGTEWFCASPRLLKHIDKMARRHPLPTLPLRYRMKAIGTMTLEVPEPTPAETTQPIFEPLPTREKARVQRRDPKRTYHSMRERASVLELAGETGGKSDTSVMWVFFVTVYAIAAGIACRVFDTFWIAPLALVAMMLFYTVCDVQKHKATVRRAQNRAEARFWSVVRREGLGTSRNGGA